MNQILDELYTFKNVLESSEQINQIDDIINFVNNKPEIGKKCYIVLHNGLGDHILMNGAIKYLSYFYNEVYIICKQHYFNCLLPFYQDFPGIKLLPLEDNGIYPTISNFVQNGNDIFNSSFCFYFEPKVKTDNIFLKRKFTLDNPDYFAAKFYSNINLPWRISYEYFSALQTEKSKELKNLVKDYKVIFLHEQSSNLLLNFEPYININNQNELYVCTNRNLYSEGIKKEICDKFLNLDSIVHYIDTIKIANKFLLIDSSISCLILMLNLKEQTVTDDINIYYRGGVEINSAYRINQKIKCIMI